jgi:hypothetical protein
VQRTKSLIAPMDGWMDGWMELRFIVKVDTANNNSRVHVRRLKPSLIDLRA